MRRYPRHHLLLTIFRFVTSPIPFSTARTFTAPAHKNPSPKSTGRDPDARGSAQYSFPGSIGRRLIEPKNLGSILWFCAERKDVGEGRGLHAYIIVSGFSHDVIVCNHLISMYGKCGFLEDAHVVFEDMGQRNLFSWNNLISCYCKAGYLESARKLFDEMPSRDSVSWNIMVSGYDHHGPCEEALEIFVRMRRSGCRIDHCGVSSVISACSTIRALSVGREIHGLCTKTGLDSDVQVGSALVELFGKCLVISDSRRVFGGMSHREQCTWNSMLASYIQCSRVDEAILLLAEMPEKNLVSWTTIIAGCNQHNRNEEAIVFFYELLKTGMKLDEVSLVSFLSACVGLFDLVEGRKIHGIIVKSGFESNVFIASVLITLYAKCGILEDARILVDKMPSVDDCSWSVMITEYAKHGLIECACELFRSLKVKSLALWNSLITSYSEIGQYINGLEAFQTMCADGIVGDEFTFGSLLTGSHVLGIGYAKQLHIQVIKVGTNSSVFVSSALIDTYCYFSDCEAATRVFHSISKPNLVLWNALIFGYGQNNMGLEALSTLHLMLASTVKPDSVTFSCILDSCSSPWLLNRGVQLHSLAYKMGLESDVAVGTAILSMYGKCEKMDHASIAFSDINQHNVVSWSALLGIYVRHGMWSYASEIFNIMPEKNIISWNTMLSGHAKHGSGLEAVKLYCQMNRSGVFPDHISFVSLLTACCNFSLEEQGKQIHGQIIKTGFHLNAFVKVALNDLYQKFEKLQEIERSDSICTQCKQGKFQDSDELHAVSWNV